MSVSGENGTVLGKEVSLLDELVGKPVYVEWADKPDDPDAWHWYFLVGVLGGWIKLAGRTAPSGQAFEGLPVYVNEELILSIEEDPCETD